MNKLLEKRGWTLMLAGMFASAVVYQSYSGYQVLQKKSAEQTSLTGAIVAWKESLVSLKGTNVSWAKTYRNATDIKDLREIISLLNLAEYKLYADTDKLTIVNANPVKVNEVDIGLIKLCIANDSEEFSVQAASYQVLLEGIARIASRADVTIGNIQLYGEKPQPQASLSQLCILLRNV